MTVIYVCVCVCVSVCVRACVRVCSFVRYFDITAHLASRLLFLPIIDANNSHHSSLPSNATQTSTGLPRCTGDLSIREINLRGTPPHSEPATSRVAE